MGGQCGVYYTVELHEYLLFLSLDREKDLLPTFCVTSTSSTFRVFFLVNSTRTGVYVRVSVASGHNFLMSRFLLPYHFL